MDAVAFVRSSRGPQRATAPHDESTPAQLLVPFGAERESFACLDDSDGRTLWVHRSGGVLSSAVWDARRIYVGCSDGSLTALDRRTGELLWQESPGGAMWDPCGAGDSLLVGGADGTLLEVEAATGIVVRRASMGSSMVIPAQGLDKFWLSVQEGKLVCLEGRTLRPIWRKSFEAPLASAVLGVPGSIAAPLANGVIHVVEEETGRWQLRLEGSTPAIRPTLAGYVYCVVAGRLRAYDAYGQSRMDAGVSDIRSLATSYTNTRMLILADCLKEIAFVTELGGDPEPIPLAGLPVGRIRSEGSRLYALRERRDPVPTGPGTPALATVHPWVHAIDLGVGNVAWSTCLA